MRVDKATASDAWTDPGGEDGRRTTTRRTAELQRRPAAAAAVQTVHYARRTGRELLLLTAGRP